MKIQKGIFYANAVGKPFEEFFGCALNHTLYISRSQTVDYYYHENEWNAFKEFSRKKLQSDKKWLQFLLNDYHSLWKPHLRFLNELQQTDLTRLSNRELFELFERYKQSLKSYLVPMWLVVLIEQEIEETVLGVLKRAGSKTIDSDALVIFSPSEPNFLAQEEFELYTISRLPTNKQQPALRLHTQKFAYIPMYDYDYEPFSLEHFSKQLIEIKKNPAKVTENHRRFEKNKKQFEQLLQKLKLGQMDELVLRAMHFLFNQKDQRSHYRSWDSFAAKKLFDEIAKRTGYSLSDLLLLMDDEIKDSLLSKKKPLDLTERKQDYSLLITPQKIELLTGEPMHRFLEKTLPMASQNQIQGLGVSPGIVRGAAKIVLKPSESGKLQPGDILVTTMTRPDFVSFMKKCGGIVTDEGSLLCHAAIVGRELGLPCVVGTKTATTSIKDGDQIEVDAHTGIVKKLAEAAGVNDLQKQNYKELFRVEANVTCLHSEFFVQGALRYGNPLILYENGTWHSFINKEKEQDCLKKGLELFSSKKNYQEYADAFRKYISKAKKELIPQFKVVPKDITKQQFQTAATRIGELWKQYQITEFSYTDLAYRKWTETHDPTLEKNLGDLEKLKFEGREILNAFMFLNGTIPNLLRSISKKFMKNEDDAFYLFSNELLSLFDNKNYDPVLIEKRRKYYGIINNGDKPIILSPTEVKNLAEEFTKVDAGKNVRGETANPGTATGRVVVAPMLNDMKKVSAIVKRMKKGDVLVAQSTTPELMPLCKLASAIVTDQGGMLSHAAIVSREMNIPCIIGTIHATQIFKDGDWVEVDATRGVVRILKKKN